MENKLDHDIKYRSHNYNIMFVISCILVGELVLGGSGRLVVFGSFLTLRYVVFLLVMAAFVFSTLYRRQVDNAYSVRLACVLLCLFLLFAIIGLFRGHALHDVFQQLQGYLYIAVVFPLQRFICDKEKAKTILRVFFGSTVALACVSIAVFIIVQMDTSRFSAVSGLFESMNMGAIAILPNGIVRVFFKTSVFFVIAFGYYFYDLVANPAANIALDLGLSLLFAIAIFLSFTMGSWIAAFLCFVVVLISLRKKLVAKLIAVGVLFLLVFLLLASDTMPSFIVSRFNGEDESVIVKSGQIRDFAPLILASPIISQGLGYKFSSTTILGTRSGLHIEIFWVELLVTMGIVTFLVIAISLLKSINMARRLAFRYAGEDKSMLMALAMGLFALCIMTTSNPFMNNPIGLGYWAIMLVVVENFLLDEKKRSITDV